MKALTCSGPDGATVAVRAEGSEWAVLAQTVEVVIGKVFHYDRGELLLPGERIADGVQRKPAEPDAVSDRVRHHGSSRLCGLPSIPAGDLGHYHPAAFMFLRQLKACFDLRRG